MVYFNNVVENITDELGLTIPIIFLVAIVITTIYFVFKIQRSKLVIEDSVTWIIFNLILMIIGIIMVAYHAGGNEKTLDDFAGKFGFQSFETLVLLLVAGWMWLRLFKITSRFSFLKNKVSEISQELGKMRYELDNKTKNIFEEKEKEDKE